MAKVKKTKILFVCMGNICRSPAGENVMRYLLDEQGNADEYELDSAGTIGYHTGNSPDARMIEAAERRGIPMRGQARQVQAADFNQFDWIVAMDQDNYDDLVVLQNQAESPKAKLVKFCEFCSEHDATDVPDPYYGGADGFELVLD